MPNQREVKFRAWDKNEKEMYDDILYERGIEGGVRPWIIMQYTGLKDKNGKEIYEGDIIKHFGRTGDFTGKDFILKVFYDNAHGGFVPFGFHSYAVKCIDYKEWKYDCEVIGNIYENPELIKEG